MRLWALYERERNGWSPYLLEVSSDAKRIRDLLTDGQHDNCYIEEQQWVRFDQEISK